MQLFQENMIMANYSENTTHIEHADLFFYYCLLLGAIKAHSKERVRSYNKEHILCSKIKWCH